MVQHHYYIGEGPEADALIAELKSREDKARKARMNILKEYGADALVMSVWKRGNPAGLGFKEKQNLPFLKGGTRYDEGFAYYPKRSTKAGKELAVKLEAPELEFEASDYIIKTLKLHRMEAGRHSGSHTGMALYHSVAGYCDGKLLVKIPAGKSGSVLDPMLEIPAWLRPCKESEFLAAQGL